MTTVTLELYADTGPKGVPVREEVRARPLGRSTFEIVQSPGLVLGIAAGDVIELNAEDNSRFQVRKRGGNLCIQVFCPSVTDELQQRFATEIVRLGGWLDGRSSKELVFSIPVSVGFRAIEDTLVPLVSSCPGCEWYYGNVYDPKDGVTPLNWWPNL